MGNLKNSNGILPFNKKQNESWRNTKHHRTLSTNPLPTNDMIAVIILSVPLSPSSVFLLGNNCLLNLLLLLLIAARNVLVLVFQQKEKPEEAQSILPD
jgi:hypothetical protein